MRKNLQRAISIFSVFAIVFSCVGVLSRNANASGSGTLSSPISGTFTYSDLAVGKYIERGAKVTGEDDESWGFHYNGTTYFSGNKSAIDTPYSYHDGFGIGVTSSSSYNNWQEQTYLENVQVWKITKIEKNTEPGFGPGDPDMTKVTINFKAAKFKTGTSGVTGVIDDSKKLTISGSGVTNPQENAPAWVYYDEFSSLSMPSTITGLGDYCLLSYIGNSFTIPSHIKTLGNMLFEQAIDTTSNVKTITIKDNLTSIGEKAFQGIGTQSNPATVVLPSNWTGTKPDETTGKWYGGYFTVSNKKSDSEPSGDEPDDGTPVNLDSFNHDKSLEENNFLSAELVGTKEEIFNVTLEEEEKNQVTNGVNASVWLTADDITDKVDNNDKNKVENAIPSGYKLDKYTDLNLLKKIGDGEAFKISKCPNGKVKIALDIPKGTNGNSYKMIRLHNGEASVIDTVVKGDKMQFETDMFSTYAIAYSEKTNLTTGDNNNFALFMLIGVVIAGAGIIICSKKHITI